MKAFTVVKASVVLPVVALTSLAYSSIFPRGGYLIGISLAIILIGLLVSSGSAGRVVFLSMVLYTVPFTIGVSQFLPVAFPTAYRQLGEAILSSPYFSDVRVVFILVALSIVTEFVERAEEWERALEGMGGREIGLRMLAYALPAVFGALAISLVLLRLSNVAGLKLSGVLLPILLLLTGMVLASGAVEGGPYRRVVVAVELRPPRGGGEIVVKTPREELRLPLRPSASFEWDVVRIEVETSKRPTKVILKSGGQEKPLNPLMESVDGKTLFILYRPKEG